MKCICIKDLNDHSICFYKNKIYDIVYHIKYKGEDIYEIGYKNSLHPNKTKHLIGSEDFKDHFITLAEFREDRINKILEYGDMG